MFNETCLKGHFIPKLPGKIHYENDFSTKSWNFDFLQWNASVDDFG